MVVTSQMSHVMLAQGSHRQRGVGTVGMCLGEDGVHTPTGSGGTMCVSTEGKEKEIK